MAGKPSKRDIEFLFEIGTLRYINRAWVQFMTPDFANLPEHLFRVMWIAFLIASREDVKDTGKVLKMALAHNIGESRTGDVHYLSRQYTERNKNLAMADIVSDTAFEKEVVDLFNEYEERKTIEAKIVKDADNLDIDLELCEQASRGNDIKDIKKQTRQRIRETQFYTDTAKEIWDSIQKANPHDWHLLGRNRLNAGDWKKE